MMITACPYCETSHVEWLEQLSQGAWVDYYECQTCGHIWPVAKDDFDADIVEALPPVEESHK